MTLSPLHSSHRVLAGGIVVAGLLASSVAHAQATPRVVDPAAEPEVPVEGPPSPHNVPVAPVSPSTVMPPRAAPPPVEYVPPPEPEAATLLSGNVEHGAYIGPDGKLTTLAGSAAVLAGAQAGWIVDHVFVLGGGAYALASEVSAPAVLQTENGPTSRLSLTYGGARMSFVPAAKRALHLVFGVLVGGGRVSVRSSGVDRVADSFFVVEPDAAFEVNIARPVRLAIGASYRFTGGTGIASLTTTAMNGPTAFLTIKLGAF
jgi:hypothetical protein